MKYIYLDDESGTSSIAELLSSEADSLEIQPLTPLPFREEIERLRNAKLDGLILDLRLDQVTNSGQRAEYRALTLAQEIRTRATEGLFKSFPLIMCSTDERINKSFKKDETGHDLFDARYIKDEMDEDSTRVANELVCLAAGYKRIEAIKKKAKLKVNLTDLFGVTNKKSHMIDKRLTSYFTVFDGKLPNHEYARLVLKEMIQSPGVLIDEQLLAARLGIDREKSSDWKKLIFEISNCSYKGVFNEAWPRWWMHLISDWWLSLKSCPANLSYLEADERVDFLSKTFKWRGLTPSKAINSNYSNKFWTICKGFVKPIDPIDGFVVDGKYTHPWQDKEYISEEAALKRIKYKEGIRIHPLETERFDILKNERRNHG